MPHHPGPSSREFVHPNREALRALRDSYMRQMEARSYEEVRSKFLEELHSKRPSEARERSASSLQRERGAGIWNKAFASTSQGKMLRSSIVLLAEFFGVEPKELLLEGEQAPRPPHPLQDSSGHSPSRQSPRRAPAAVLTFNSISSDGGVHIQGPSYQKVLIRNGFVSVIARDPGSPADPSGSSSGEDD